MMTDYERMGEAIGFLQEHFREQRDLSEEVGQFHLSPFHYQQLFKDQKASNQSNSFRLLVYNMPKAF